MKKFFTKKNINILLIIISACILLAFFINNNGIESMKSIARYIKAEYIFMLFICVGLYWIFEALSIYSYSKKINPKIGFWRVLKISMLGLYYNALTPFASGGQPIQVYYMTESGFDAGAATSIIAMRAIVFHFFVAIYTVFAALVGYSVFSEVVPGFLLFALLGIFVNLGIVIILIFIAKNYNLSKKIVRSIILFLNSIHIVKKKQDVLDKAMEKVESFHSAYSMFKDSVSTNFFACVSTFLQLLSLYAIPYFIALVFNDGKPDFLLTVMAQAFVFSIAAIVPLPGGSGGAEGSFTLFFKDIFSKNTLMPAILIWRIITYYLVIFVGAVILAFDGGKKLNDRSS